MTIRGLLQFGRRAVSSMGITTPASPSHPYTIEELLRKAGLKPGWEVVAIVNDRELLFRTPEVAAEADTDRTILDLLRFLALSVDRDLLVGRHIDIGWNKEIPFYPSPVPPNDYWLRGTEIAGTVTKADTFGIEVQPDGAEGFFLSVYIDEILLAIKLVLDLDSIPYTLYTVPQTKHG